MSAHRCEAGPVARATCTLMCIVAFCFWPGFHGTLARTKPKELAAIPAASATPLPLPAPRTSPGASPTLKLTQNDAIRLAFEHNRGLKVAERQEKEAWWAYKIAGKAPSLTVSLNYSGGKSTNNFAGQTRDLNVSATENFAPFGNTAWNGRVAYKAYEIARANVLQTRLTLLQSVKDAFFGLLVAQNQRQVGIENLKLADDLYGITQKKFKAGAGPRMDVLNAEIQRATSVQALTQAEGALRQARAALIPLLELSASSADNVEATGSADLPDIKVVVAQLLAVAKELHPQILVAQRALDQSRIQVRAARSQANPAVSLGYVYDIPIVDFPATSPLYLWSASVSVPFDWGQILYGVRQQQESVREKEHALTNARNVVVANIKETFAAYQAALSNASTYRSSVLDRSEELLAMTRLGYSKGALSFIVLLNAEQNVRAARAQYNALLLSGHQALDALEAAVGVALEKGSPVPPLREREGRNRP